VKQELQLISHAQAEQVHLELVEVASCKKALLAAAAQRKKWLSYHDAFWLLQHKPIITTRYSDTTYSAVARPIQHACDAVFDAAIEVQRVL